jgi:hypothetical protein
VQPHLPMRRSQGAAILAKKYEKLMPASPGLSAEARTSNNASANTTEKDWTLNVGKDVALREASESIRSSETSTLRQDAVSAMATCTSTI